MESNRELKAAGDRLDAWIEARDFRGHDPFDALLSPLARPIRSLRWPAVAWTQLRRRSALDLAPLLRIPPHENPKALALVLEARLRNDAVEAAEPLVDRLLDLQTPEGGWGYPFPWANRHFRAPAGTPSGVVTGFVVRALRARLAHQDAPERIAAALTRAADFVSRRLPRLRTSEGLVFSYTPGDDRAVYNASLLAAEVLATVGREHEAVDAAVDTVLRVQTPDGLLPYGASGRDAFIDSYHTGYILSSLRRIQADGVLPDGFGPRIEDVVDRGLAAWRRTFRIAEGVAHRPGQPYPVDLHGVAQGILTLLEFENRLERALDEACELAEWALRDARNPDGTFHYLWRPEGSIRTPYLRWVQSWMLIALRTLQARLETG